jgi:ADP-ribose pyrophosphatase
VTNGKVDLIEKTTPFTGYFRVDRYVLRFRRFDGSWSAPVTREIFERGHAIGLLLFDPERDAVGLCEQFRPGALAAGWPPWLVEIPAGIIDAGQSPEQVAIREAWEETGSHISAPLSVCRYLATPGGSSESMEIFAARIDSRHFSGVHGLAGEHEDIRIFALPLAEALTWIEDSRIGNAMTIIALQWLALHRQRLIDAWSA